MRRLTVVTPEMVPLEYRLAGMAERGIAWVCDEILITAVTTALMMLAYYLGILSGGLLLPVGVPVAIVGSFVVNFGYRWFAEARFRGRTLGKRVMGLRVVQDNGSTVMPWQALVRNVARPVDALPLFYLLGAGFMFLDPLTRRVGDRLAGTVVIREKRHLPPRTARVLATAGGSIAEDGGAVSRIRTRLTEREGVVLSEFVAAADRMETARRLELSRRLADHYRGRLGLDAHSGLPDEAVLRGIVGVVARDRFGSPERVR